MKVAVECPGCGTSVEIDPGGRSAELFCARCDYPLFWVRPPRLEEGDVDTVDVVLRRRPGASGIRMPATVPCPACSELNFVVAVVCIRCASPMQPEPEPEPEPVVEPPPPPPAVLVPEPDHWWRTWMTVVLVFLAVVVLIALLVLLLQD